MNIIQRAQDILLKPKDTWPTIAGEADDPAAIYKKYLVFLAAIPALAGFIGLSLIGFGSFRMPLLWGLVNLVVGYVLSLVMIYVVALIVDALAPTFGASKNFNQAFKLVAYSATASMVGGIFSLVPALSMLGVLAGLYSIYLIYTGLPVLMHNPEEKSVPYTVVIVICAVVAGVILGVVSSALTPGMRMGGF